MTKTEFAKILERKIKLQDSKDSTLTSSSPQSSANSTLDFSKIDSLSFGFYSINSSEFKKSSYKFKQNGWNEYLHFSNQTKTSSTKKKESAELPNRVNEPRIYIQSSQGAVYVAWIQLRSLGPSPFMMDSLNLKEAKKGYRTLLKKLHPDHNSNCKTNEFLSFVSAFQIIEEALQEAQ